MWLRICCEEGFSTGSKTFPHIYGCENSNTKPSWSRWFSSSARLTVPSYSLLSGNKQSSKEEDVLPSPLSNSLWLPVLVPRLSNCHHGLLRSNPSVDAHFKLDSPSFLFSWHSEWKHAGWTSPPCWTDDVQKPDQSFCLQQLSRVLVEQWTHIQSFLFTALRS